MNQFIDNALKLSIGFCLATCLGYLHPTGCIVSGVRMCCVEKKGDIIVKMSGNVVAVTSLMWGDVMNINI